MRIDELTLTNFRGFADLTLPLHPRATVLIGKNGTGKSSVLQALTVAAGSWLVDFPDTPRRNFWPADLRVVAHEHEGGASIERAGTTRVEVRGEVQGRELTWARENRNQKTTVAELGSLRALGKSSLHAVQEGREVDLPVIAFFGTGRLWSDKRDVKAHKTQEKLQSRLQGYRASVFATQDRSQFEAWMAWRESVRLQRLDRARREGASFDPVAAPMLDAIERTALACLEGAQRFYYDFGHQQIRVQFEDGRTLPYWMLSDGARALLTVAADIAWRCARLNPHLGGEATQKSKGIVLIDEIGLLLHPTWQRRVLPDLVRAFPNLQFVVTTHSPQVVSTAEPAWMRVLDIDPEGHGTHYAVDQNQGWDTNRILDLLMDTPPRPERETRAIEALREALDDDDLPAAREHLASLDHLLRAADPEVLHLSYELKDAERSR